MCVRVCVCVYVCVYVCAGEGGGYSLSVQKLLGWDGMLLSIVHTCTGNFIVAFKPLIRNRYSVLNMLIVRQIRPSSIHN